MRCLACFFRRHRSEYYDRLQAIAGDGDREDWLDFFLLGVIEIGREAATTAAAILSMREEVLDPITEGMGRVAANGHRITDRLFEHPIVAVATVRQWRESTPPGANNRVNGLVEIGVLSAVRGFARDRRFRFDPHLRWFEERS
jgi:Fic family protein